MPSKASAILRWRLRSTPPPRRATHGIAAAAVDPLRPRRSRGCLGRARRRQGCVTMIVLGGTTPPFAMTAVPGAAPALHTNPIAIAAPAHRLAAPARHRDQHGRPGQGAGSRSHAARRCRRARSRRADGRRSSDPAELERGGALLPVGGHKGFGLSAMVEALSMSLTGADAAGLEPQEGALVICLDGGAFRQPAAGRRLARRAACAPAGELEPLGAGAGAR